MSMRGMLMLRYLTEYGNGALTVSLLCRLECTLEKDLTNPIRVVILCLGKCILQENR